MHFQPLTALTTLFPLALLPTAVLAAPTAQPQGTPTSSSSITARQFYDGPCLRTNCGVAGTDCAAKRQWCVKYPSFDAPEGCTCSAL
ncbi:Uu.00g117960.m01.CDS01 [Anthostomella pinea]|uniref:Uu.00g117960.m01.CDS01 n=1 Tax=Anthostomella pinea TaxID=933095 RepID=A0AAI8VB38_9PEZI|nr:Uu.00g117960.m01.CDS01 [Anthostomella pinea]